MQPYINPYLFSNPFLAGNGSNISPVQQMQNTNNFQNPIGIAGRYVNDFSEVNANDVPMNGSPAIFAKNDRSEIQMREWSPTGQIVTSTYKLFVEAPEPVAEPKQIQFDAKAELLDPILERLTEIEQKIGRVNRTAGKEKADDQLQSNSKSNKTKLSDDE